MKWVANPSPAPAFIALNIFNAFNLKKGISRVRRANFDTTNILYYIYIYIYIYTHFPLVVGRVSTLTILSDLWTDKHIWVKRDAKKLICQQNEQQYWTWLYPVFPKTSIHSSSSSLLTLIYYLHSCLVHLLVQMANLALWLVRSPCQSNSRWIGEVWRYLSGKTDQVKPVVSSCLKKS